MGKEKMNTNENKTIFLLHIIILFYSFSGVVAKFASRFPFLFMF